VTGLRLVASPDRPVAAGHPARAIGAGGAAAGVRAALTAFGVPAAGVARQPTLTSTVYRVRVGERILYLKRHPGDAATRIRWAAEVVARLRRHGIRVPRFRLAGGALYAQAQGWLFTLAEGVDGRPLTPAALAATGPARRLGVFLARVHRALNVAAGPPDLPVPALLDDGAYPARVLAARQGLERLPSTRARAELLRVLAAAEDMAETRRPLGEASPHHGLVHGDFWPGNLLAARGTRARLTVLEPETCCRAPLLVDVAHFADLGFRLRAGGGALALALPLATAFARAYARAAGLPGGALRALPDVLQALREHSILWIAECHLARGPNPLDALVSNDRAILAFLGQARDRWADALETVHR
jgi:Ser/Thr protein kinase RdoA (MazF antagonist)